MIAKFTIPVPAFSINKMNTRDARFKTAAYKDWAVTVLHHLRQVPELQHMAKMAHSQPCTFHIQIIANYPAHVFWNKKGEISSKTVDCSNFSKPILDLIFDDTMGLNDKLVTSLKEEKRAGSDFSLEITLVATAAALVARQG